ncbi:MAG TPA: general secretion pathway protein GspB [Steroidobacteraceae bacterium]|nr:general secretion pathway protein GspB [Steroidobacteraceae bacterium]
MSFILDALKKSENERQRKVGPSLADVHVRPAENNRPWWAYAIAALLLINLGVLIVALTRNHTAVQPQTSVAASAPSSSIANGQRQTSMPIDSATQSQGASLAPAPAAPERTPPSTNAAVHPLAEEAGVPANEMTEPNDAPNPSLAAAALPPEGPPMVRPIEAPSVAPANTTPTFASRTQESKQPDEILPTASDLIASGKQLPELHLDIHVHSPNPAERFVFVNMHKYVEGQTLTEGPTVERITPEGVILNQNGLRFLLPRQ